jgi:hypothetical protein
VGCLQIDLFYHADAFSSLEEAFEPAINAAYGATLLLTNRIAFGDWTSAVAFYHSRDLSRQADYIRRVNAVYAPLGQGPSLGDGVLGGRLGQQSPSTSSAPRMITVHLSFMTITRAVNNTQPISGGR